MSKLLKSLSEDEIKEMTQEGKGYTVAQCLYYIGVCSSGYDSGTCSWILSSCGYTPAGSSSGCSTCTCR